MQPEYISVRIYMMHTRPLCIIIIVSLSCAGKWQALMQLAAGSDVY